jgi:DNA-binding MarR family transcriptional regulator
MAAKSATQLDSATIDRTLGELLVDAVRLMRRDFYARTQGLNLTPALARALFVVNREPGSSQADLAAALEVTPVTLGRMIDRLVDRKYVRRVADPVDRRAFRVYVDRAGEPLVVKLVELGDRTTACATRGISKREYATLERQLAQIVRNLSNGHG